MLFFIAAVLILCFYINSAEYVPVYMLDTNGFPEMVPALERLNQDTFKNILLQKKTSPVLVFAEQNLSPEDFILYDGEGNIPFSHLSALRKSTKTSYWPFVKNPIEAVKELPDREVTEASIKSISSDLNFSFHNDDILIIDLNDATENEDRVQMLKRHDKIVMEMYNKFSKNHKDIIALFTGYHSSWIISEELRSHRRIRDASDTNPKADEKATNSSGIIINTSDVLMYASPEPTLSFKGVTVHLTNIKGTVSRNETYMTITLVSEDISVIFDVQLSSGYYTLETIKVVNEKGDPKDYNLWVNEVYAPEGFSYHCTSQSFFDLKDKNVNLTLPNFQFQIYFASNNTEQQRSFGDAYDCVGFTSVPIWSGLFVTFILVLIMTVGLTMMMDIKTMDRFDDPKSKTITINVSE